MDKQYIIYYLKQARINYNIVSKKKWLRCVQCFLKKKCVQWCLHDQFKKNAARRRNSTQVYVGGERLGNNHHEPIYILKEILMLDHL